MHEHTLRRVHAAFYAKTLYTGLYNPRWLPNSEGFTLAMNVKVERLSMEILLSQPRTPPRYNLPPQQSPVAGTRLDEPGVPHTVTQQTEREGTFPFHSGIDGFLCVDCTRIPEQGGNLPSQADVGVKPETTTTAQVTARQEFARPPKNRRQRTGGGEG